MTKLSYYDKRISKIIKSLNSCYAFPLKLRIKSLVTTSRYDNAVMTKFDNNINTTFSYSFIKISINS